MKTLVPAFFAAALSLSSFAGSSASAASTIPLAMTGIGSGASGLEDLVQVQSRRFQHDRRGVNRRGHHRPGYDNRGRRPPVHRPPPRQQSRSGPDLGSAIVGAIIGGVIVNQFRQSGPSQPPQRGYAPALSQNHISWCHNRWRSYRVSDNSYQPYNGPRRICVSPYGPN